MVFVDGYDFAAYEAAGFKSIQDNDVASMTQVSILRTAAWGLVQGRGSLSWKV